MLYEIKNQTEKVSKEFLESKFYDFCLYCYIDLKRYNGLEPIENYNELLKALKEQINALRVITTEDLFGCLTWDIITAYNNNLYEDLAKLDFLSINVEYLAPYIEALKQIRY